MKRMYVFALLAVLAATVMAADYKNITQGHVTAKIELMGGKCTFMMDSTDDDDDSESSSENSDDENAAATAEPAADATTAAAADEAAGNTRKRRSTDEKKGEKVTAMLAYIKEWVKVGDDDDSIALAEDTREFAMATANLSEMMYEAQEDMTDAKIANTKNSKDEEIKAKAIGVKKTVENDGPTLMVTVYMAEEAGKLHIGDDEKVDVPQSSAVIVLEIDGWTYCTRETTACGSKTSNHLEMALRVEGDGEAKKGDGLKYDIGQDNTIALPTMALLTKADDTTEWMKFSTDYPMYQKTEGEGVSSSSDFKVGVPVENEKKIWYAAVIDFTPPGTEGTPTSRAAPAVVGSVLTSVMAAILAAVCRM